MKIRSTSDFMNIPSIVTMLLCAWTLVMCVLVFVGPDDWMNSLYETLAIFIGVVCIYEILTGSIQKFLIAHFSKTTDSNTSSNIPTTNESTTGGINNR